MASLMMEIEVPPHSKIAFINWQAQLHQAVVSLPGFVSLDISSTFSSPAPIWTLVQRFDTAAHLGQWRASSSYQQLFAELTKLLNENTPNFIKEKEYEDSQLQGGVTEVFITEVAKDKEKIYQEWIANIHEVEAHFPGFKGLYVQSPEVSQGRNWITLLQFDTTANLDRWLSSPQRKEILNQSKSFIHSLESHRMVSPYEGWFKSLTKTGPPPPTWKQSMTVLLVLFPIVMLELHYLNSWTKDLNPALATFIGNVISVALLGWPMMPIAIWLLSWWLSPEGEHQKQKTLLGVILILGLYFLEILLFWR